MNYRIHSADLAPSPLWTKYSEAIGRERQNGTPFEDILEMNVAIKMRDQEPYKAHRRRLDEVLWHDDPNPKTILDLGAGYGAMAPYWPAGSSIYNIDLPEMLEIQEVYVTPMDALASKPWFVPLTEADSVPLAGAYLFSVWALTETTRVQWEYWIERAPVLAGAYVLGHAKWIDEDQAWPWMELAQQFSDVHMNQPSPGIVELIGRNR